MFNMSKTSVVILFVILVTTQAQPGRPIVELPPGQLLRDVSSYLASKTFSFFDLTETDCDRPCVANRPRICYFKFVIENYQAMGAACGDCGKGVLADCFKPQCVPTDGFEKGVITINRQIPGPLIEVCKNDMIVVDVENLMHSETFSMHWHGILQRDTPYSDGVPYVTQCPIIPLTSFRYTFSTPESGTFFYHSHSGVQRYSGVYGGLIVRDPKSLDPLGLLYDDDTNVMIVSDWTHVSPENFLLGLPTQLPGLLPEASLINGKGKFLSNGTTFTSSPYETFYVTPGKRYRFRIIDAGSTVCFPRIQFQGHRMTLIATDGNNVIPVPVDTLSLTSGERFDVIVEASASGSGMFWIHVRLMGPCNDQTIFQSAVLSYQPRTSVLGLTPPTVPTLLGYSVGVSMNSLQLGCGVSPSNLCITDLKALAQTDIVSRVPDLKLYWNFVVKQMNTSTFFERRAYTPFFNIINSDIFLATLNDLSFLHQESPLLSQILDADHTKFCSSERTPSHCKDLEICTCTQVVNIRQNALVEIVLIDAAPGISRVVHPLHFHGYKFSVLNQGLLPTTVYPLTVESVKQFEAQGLLKGNNTFPPIKDTVSTFNRGYSVIRFYADNPGQWFVHCHIEDHMIFGMNLVMNVAGMVPPVPPKFPRCGSFK